MTNLQPEDYTALTKELLSQRELMASRASTYAIELAKTKKLLETATAQIAILKLKVKELENGT